MNPLEHFVRHGAAHGRDPHPLFDTSYYLRQYPDVVAAGVNPLAHFLEIGAAQGRSPHPLFHAFYYPYLAYFKELGDAWVEPLVHLTRTGDADGCRPHPLFDPSYISDTTPMLLRRVSIRTGIFCSSASVKDAILIPCSTLPTILNSTRRLGTPRATLLIISWQSARSKANLRTRSSILFARSIGTSSPLRAARRKNGDGFRCIDRERWATCS